MRNAKLKMQNAELRKKCADLGLHILIIIYIFNNIGNITVKDAAEVIYLHSTDAVSFFHTVDGCTADVILVYQSICRYVFFF